MAKKPKSYNPLTQPLPSIDVIRMRARRRAHREALAAAAAVPQDAVVTAANDSLIKSLRGTADSFGRVVQNAGRSYADTTAGAKTEQAGAMAQLGAAPGTAAPPDTRGGLIGAMAANNLAPMTAAIVGAQQALPGRLEALHGKRAAILAGEDATFEKYYQAGLDDALRSAAAQQNAALSQQNADVNAAYKQDTLALSADRNAIARDRNQIARDKLTGALAGVTDKDQRAAIKEANRIVSRMLSGKSTSERTVAGVYHFTIPATNPPAAGTPGNPTGDLKAKPAVKVSIKAKNGNEALRLFIDQMEAKAAAGLIGKDQYQKANAKLYYDGDATMEPVKEKVRDKPDRQRALAEARRYLESAGFSSAEALRIARKLLGSKMGGTKKKAKKPASGTSTPGSTGIG